MRFFFFVVTRSMIVHVPRLRKAVSVLSQLMMLGNLGLHNESQLNRASFYGVTNDCVWCNCTSTPRCTYMYCDPLGDVSKIVGSQQIRLSLDVLCFVVIVMRNIESLCYT